MTNDAHESRDFAPAPKPETNALGLAGFIISLVGLCSLGTLSVIGLILSFVALFRRPRGFAIAGFVLGLIGVSFILIITAIVGIATLGALMVGLVEGRGYIEAGIDSLEIREAIARYERDNGSLPASVDDLSDLDADDLNDRWGRPYRIEIDTERQELRLVSDGPDGQADTDDDIEIELSLN